MSALCNHPKKLDSPLRISRRLDLASTLVVTLTAFLSACQPVRAADLAEMRNPPRLRSPAAPLTDKDCQIALFAREALLRDEALARLNLGVTVHGETAILWGTVPNIALSRRAEEKVRGVLGLVQVKNELRIEAGDDDALEFLQTPDPALREPARRRNRPIPLVSRGEQSLPGGNKPAADSPPLMPPIPVPAGPQQTVSLFEPPMTQPVLNVSSRSSLVETLERLRRSNERYRSIRLEVQGGVVRLWSNAANGEDLFIFAQRVSHIPGVQRVIVERGR
jgi:BON domain